MPTAGEVKIAAREAEGRNFQIAILPGHRTFHWLLLFTSAGDSLSSGGRSRSRRALSKKDEKRESRNVEREAGYDFPGYLFQDDTVFLHLLHRSILPTYFRRFATIPWETRILGVRRLIGIVTRIGES